MAMDRDGVKRDVQIAFEEVLKTLDALEREPDPAEQLGLVDALCSMANGQYISAATKIYEISKLIQSKASVVSKAKPRITKDMMRRGLTHIRVHR